MPLDLYGFINKHLKFHKSVSYGEGGVELLDLIDMVKSSLCQPELCEALIDVPIPLIIVGDTHGQFFDLQRIFLSIGLPGSQRYLFLGDYVDRGPHSVECIALLLALKLCAPSKIFLLRGNHESPCVNKSYGFNEELNRRFDTAIATRLYKEFNYIFAHLPLAALVRGKILCMHGGISPRLESLDDIRKLKLPIEDPASNTLEEDLLWSDPVPNLKGFEYNKSREASVCFGADEVEALCDRLNLDFIVRGHQLMSNGFGFFANGRLITIFSAPRYQKNMNKGCLLIIDDQMNMSFLLLNPVKTRAQAGEANFKTTFSEATKLEAPVTINCSDSEANDAIELEPTDNDENTPKTKKFGCCCIS